MVQGWEKNKKKRKRLRAGVEELVLASGRMLGIREGSRKIWGISQDDIFIYERA